MRPALGLSVSVQWMSYDKQEERNVMARIASVVYDPPGHGFPFLAVLLDEDGEVLVARAVPSREAGEALILSVMNDMSVSRA